MSILRPQTCMQNQKIVITSILGLYHAEHAGSIFNVFVTRERYIVAEIGFGEYDKSIINS